MGAEQSTPFGDADDSKNRCLVCSRDMGDTNPRQLCGKTHCLYESIDDMEQPIEPTPDKAVKRDRKGKKRFFIESEESTEKTAEETNNEPEQETQREKETDTESIAESEPESDFGTIEESDNTEETEQDDDSENTEETDEEPTEENTEEPTEENTEETPDEKSMDSYISEQFDPSKFNLSSKAQIKMLSQSQEYIDALTPTIPRVLAIAEKNQLPVSAFSDVIERIIILSNIPRLSVEYIEFRESINTTIEQLEELTKKQVLEYFEMKTQSVDNKPTIKQILESNTSREEKLRMMKVLEKSQTLPNMYSMEKLTIENTQAARLKYFNTSSKEAVSIIEECESIVDNNIENQLALVKEHFAPDVFASILSELKCMRNLSGDNDDGAKIRQWLKYVLALPYKTKDLPVGPDDSPLKISKFIQQAREKLNKYISGMDMVKEQILDFMLARIQNPKSKRNIYGLESSPGMGKSTIARAIADCLELPLIEIRIGGQHDVSVIKGHSRTYIGAIPGQIVSKLCSVGYKNPIIFFDEIDKASGRNNEIGSALCEVFDPDQNYAFDDHYMGFPVDLSGCLMIAAMNDKSQVNAIAIDRIQVLKIPDYTNEEKVNMALTHLIPSALKNLNISGIEFTREAADQILRKSKIKEKGVRQYIRNIDNILKKIVKMKLERSGLFSVEEPPNEAPKKKARQKKGQVAVAVEVRKITVDKNLVDQLFWEPVEKDTDHVQHMYL